MPMSFFFVLCLVCHYLFSSSCVLYFKRHWHTRHRTKKKYIDIQDTGRRKKTLAYKTQDEEKRNWHTRHRTKKKDIGIQDTRRTKKKYIDIQDTRRRKKTLTYKTQDEENRHWHTRHSTKKNINTTQKSKKMSNTEDK
jgi:hypothetical protein